MTSHYVSGAYNRVTEDFRQQGAKYDSLDLMDLYRVCESFLQVRNFDEFDQCMPILEDRLARENWELPDPRWVSKDGAMARNAIWSRFTMLQLRAEAASILGDHKLALEYANQALVLTGGEELFEFIIPVTADEVMSTVLTFGLGNLGRSFVMKDQAKQTTKTSAIVPLGIIAVAQNSLGDREAAQAALDRLAAIDTTGSSSSYFAPLKQLWLAKGLMSQEDYASALAAMTAKVQKSLYASAFQSFTGFVTSVAGDFGKVDGKALTQKDTLFSLNFEPRFMLFRAQLETGDYDSAAKGYDEILGEPRLRSVGNVYYLALYGRGRVALKQGDMEAAIDYFTRAIDEVEGQRSTIGGERNRIGFVGDKQDGYHDMVVAQISAGHPRVAFEYAERGKARALIDLLANRSSFGQGERARKSKALISELKDAEEANVLVAANDGTRGVLLQTKSKIGIEDPGLAQLVTASVPAISELQSRLRPNETMLEYFGNEKDLFVFVVDRQSIRAIRLDGHGLADDVLALRAAIIDPLSDSYVEPSHRLFKRLIQPAKRYILGNELAIVPHGILHYLPFAALNGGNEFLIDTYGIRMLPSAAVLPFVAGQSKARGTLLAFGNPDLGDSSFDLPGAEREAQVIVTGLSGAELLTRRSATETAAKTNASRYRVLHFASHATFDSEQPLNSGLLLAKDGMNDGRLSVAELYDMEIDADLVTLSACQTAMSQVANGDDLVGFTRGFLFAGSRAIVSSLWEVDDASTSALMASFYQSMSQGLSRSDALRHGQLMTRAQYAHPYYWAAFQLSGGT